MTSSWSLDKQGAPSEYAMYLNRKQDLAIDDMLAAGIATGVTAGLPRSVRCIPEHSDMAVSLDLRALLAVDTLSTSTTGSC